MVIINFSRADRLLGVEHGGCPTINVAMTFSVCAEDGIVPHHFHRDRGQNVKTAALNSKRDCTRS